MSILPVVWFNSEIIKRVEINRMKQIFQWPTIIGLRIKFNKYSITISIS